MCSLPFNVVWTAFCFTKCLAYACKNDKLAIHLRKGVDVSHINWNFLKFMQKTASSELKINARYFRKFTIFQLVFTEHDEFQWFKMFQCVMMNASLQKMNVRNSKTMKLNFIKFIGLWRIGVLYEICSCKYALSTIESVWFGTLYVDPKRMNMSIMLWKFFKMKRTTNRFLSFVHGLNIVSYLIRKVFYIQNNNIKTLFEQIKKKQTNQKGAIHFLHSMLRFIDGIFANRI